LIETTGGLLLRTAVNWCRCQQCHCQYCTDSIVTVMSKCRRDVSVGLHRSLSTSRHRTLLKLWVNDRHVTLQGKNWASQCM